MFALYSDANCTQMLQRVQADTEDGSVTFEDLPYGVYYVKESMAPHGYRQSNQVQKVVLDERSVQEGKPVMIQYENEPLLSIPTGADMGMSQALYVVGAVSSTALVWMLSSKENRKKRRMCPDRRSVVSFGHCIRRRAPCLRPAHTVDIFK